MRNYRTKQGIAVMLAALVLAVLATLYTSGEKGSLGWSVKGKPAPKVQMASASDEDMARLWTWADSEISGGSRSASWHLLWSLNGLTLAQARQAAKALGMTSAAEEENAGVKDENKSDGGILWEAARTTESGAMRLQVLGKDEGQDAQAHEVFISFNALQPAELVIMEKAIVEVDAALAGAGISVPPMMSIKLYGKAIRTGAADRMAEKAEAIRLDEYKDAKTVIRTWSSPLLNGAVQLGSGKEEQLANIQLAEHEPGGKDASPEITVGIPLITGDVSENGASQT